VKSEYIGAASVFFLCWQDGYTVSGAISALLIVFIGRTVRCAKG